MADAGPLAGKIALVTGASRGIGRGIAERLAADGAVIAATGRDEAALGAVLDAIAQTGGQAQAFPADLLAAGAAEAVATAVLEKFGRVDVLVNSAGATKRGDFLQLTDADWTDGFGLKLMAAVRVTRALWPSLRAQGGAVVNIVGIGGRAPEAEFSIGGSVNAAFMAFTKSLAARGDGVRVNAINPGAVRTDRFARRLDAIIKAEGVDAATAERKFVAESRITRVGEVQDIAALVSFILTEGSWLNGSLLDIDGGETKSI